MTIPEKDVINQGDGKRQIEDRTLGSTFCDVSYLWKVFSELISYVQSVQIFKDLVYADSRKYMLTREWAAKERVYLDVLEA